jgi:hypothetical protein
MKKWPRGVEGPIGACWRVLAIDGATRTPVVEAQNQGLFDELVLERTLHLEQMDDHTWWLQLGEAHVWITIGEDGYATKITITEGVKSIGVDGRIELACE